MNKRTLTLEQHQSLGDRLHQLYYQTLYLASDLQFLGKRHQLVTRIFNCHKKISGARSALEEQFFQDHPEQFDTHVYYPGTKREVARFEKGCDWSVVEQVLEDSWTVISQILGDILPAIAVKSNVWKTSEGSLRALESAKAALCTLIMERSV